MPTPSKLERRCDTEPGTICVMAPIVSLRKIDGDCDVTSSDHDSTE
jgi:hypothetical protein